MKHLVYNTLENLEIPGVALIDGELSYYKTPLPVNALKFTATGVSTIRLENHRGNSPVLFKSTNGKNWESWDYSIINLADGESVYIKGDNPNGLNSSWETNSLFVMEGNIACEGNIMTLLGENVTDIPCGSCFYWLFKDCNVLTSAPTLPATTMTEACYGYMFAGCTSLMKAPDLPAITLAEDCYTSMFADCSSLVTAPKLSATTLTNGCYYGMFRGCTSLLAAPELPATTLKSSCYYWMFKNCTSLVKAPDLPALTLVSSCYSYMFEGCSNLNYIKAMFTTAPTGSQLSNWLFDVAPVGTFVKNSAATWNVNGASGIPTGWTVETAIV